MRVAVVIALALLLGCATAPREPTNSIARSRCPIHSTGYGEATIETMAELNLPINKREKASGLVTTDWILVPTEYLDCGDSGLATEQDHQGRFNIFVRPVQSDADQVQLSVNSSFQALRVLGSSRGRIECVSPGTLEGQMQSLG